MQRFWDEFLLPVARGCEAKVICEIGSQFGGLTQRLLDYCIEEGAVAHVIDPAPAYDVDAWRKEYGDALVFHRQLSLEVLGKIPAPDLVLIDGDHNWYTVINELSLLERQAGGEDGSLPVIALHDIGWPYGRRDMYYDPETIPAEHRQKYENRGIRPDSESLVDEGINPELCNAVHEGGEHNGVMTAVEDFLAKSSTRWALETVPGFHGLGLLVPADRLEHEPSLQRAVARWRGPAALRAHVQALEADRIAIALGYLQAHKRADSVEAAAEAARRQQAAAEQHLRQLKRSQFRLTEERRGLREALRLIAESRTWRVGQFLASSFRALTRRSRWEGPDALQVLIDRLDSFEEKPEPVIARRGEQASVGGAREER
ncbi:MAG TPA: class I SAM-dependent methyltransferase [Thermoleophilaceae bacterium]|nr:class I SAM-dependent methyltransferase [Thermoleophilaceae bacterium]